MLTQHDRPERYNGRWSAGRRMRAPTLCVWESRRQCGGGHDVWRCGASLLRGGVDHDVLSDESGDDALYGDDGNDILNGDAGNNTLYGEAGHDTLLGGDGNDLPDGGGSSKHLEDSAGHNVLKVSHLSALMY
ncbi:MAG TPA: hypothetical protein ACQGQI_06560 [Xylella sp.]